MKLSNKEKQRLFNQYGQWAIVTGATSGIGLELATQLAAAGFNLIVTARNIAQLEALASELSAYAPIQVKVVAADLSNTEGVNQVIDASKGLKIGLLIASAGFGTSGYFIKNSIASEVNMLKVNCEALLVLTHHFSKQFVDQKRGGIILMSSMVAFQGTPYSANYAATKAYVQTLAEALAEELKSKGVDVLAAAPGPVKSGFAKVAGMNMSMALTTAQVGIPILRALGRKTTVYPGFLSKFLVYSLNLLPRFLKVKMIGIVMKQMTKHQNAAQF